MGKVPLKEEHFQGLYAQFRSEALYLHSARGGFFGKIPNLSVSRLRGCF